MDHLWCSFHKYIIFFIVFIFDQSRHRLELRLVLVDLQYFQSSAVNFYLSHHLSLLTLVQTAANVLEHPQIYLVAFHLPVYGFDGLATGEEGGYDVVL